MHGMCFPWAGAVLALALWAASPVHSAGRDVTRDYLDAFRSHCAFSSAHMQELRRYKVLLVPGYFSDLDPAYFADQLHWLDSIGAEREKVAVRSRQRVSVNAPIVATAIRESARPVILITHSKGSIDALEALRVEPSLRRKVKGWVSLQAPFLGSPVADMLLDSAQLSPLVANVIVGIFGGTMDAARGLTTSASLAYYRVNKTTIDEVVRDVPAVAFVSVLDGESGSRARTTLEVPRALMWREGIRNDGMVPLDSAVLPGMDFVKITGVDHIATVMPAVLRFDRVRMTQALLLTLRSPFRRLPPDPGCKGQR